MKIADITSYLEQIAPLSYQESYDNSGLIVGEPSAEVSHVLISLDVTEDVVEEAVSKGCELIIAHHPIVFSGLKKLNGKNYVERTVIKAIKNNVAIYAIHTNLDNVHNGVNQMICERLGLQNTRILSPKVGLLKKLVTYVPHQNAEQVKTALFEVGAGNIGAYDECSFSMQGVGSFRANEGTNPHVGEIGERHHENETKIETIFSAHLQGKVVKALLKAHPYEEVAYDIYSLDNSNSNVGSGMIAELTEEVNELDFLKLVKEKMGAGVVRYTNLLNKKVKRVAICGGSGSFLLPNAIAANADVFVTADYKYHQFFDAENKIVIADIGHYESEQFTKQLLYDILSKKFANFALSLSEINTNPINYL